ncbi:hypothetical protein [Epilithonimonas sp. UC225_85]|uniref:hypothetical protein n=1 Tax=Epilithonimonas sp. UC225_85 TaxID=3350167 RepID=UPI0036D417DB
MKINEDGFIKRIKTNQEKSKLSSDSLIDIYYKNFSNLIKFNNKYQSSFTKAVISNTPIGKIVKEYSMVGIFDEYDKSWKFIDTSILSDEELNVHFSTLSDKVKSAIKPMSQHNFDSNNLLKKCREYRNLEIESSSPFTFKKQKITILETEKKDSSNDSYFLMDIIRDQNNPCKIKTVLKDFKKENSKFKIGDEMDLEITAFDENIYYFMTKLKNDKYIFFDQGTVIKKLKP